MAKQPNLSDIDNPLTAANTHNANNDAIQAAFDNTVSRDGSAPNQMEADFDLNSNDILNVGKIDAKQLSLAGSNVVSVSSTLTWRGAWVTSTAYNANDLVSENGNSYICIEGHTSGTFPTDLSGGKWELFTQKGATGDGTGDMLASNNLSDVDDVATSRFNLGLGSAATTNSSDYATSAQGALADSSTQPTDTDVSANDWVLDEDDMASNSDTKVPTQQSVKAYVDDQFPEQSWQDVSASRASNLTVYQNTTGHPIYVNIIFSGDFNSAYFEVSSDNSTWVRVYSDSGDGAPVPMTGVRIPNNHYYRSSTSGGATDPDWYELR